MKYCERCGSPESTGTIITLVKTQEGWKHLCTLCSFYEDKRQTLQWILDDDRTELIGGGMKCPRCSGIGIVNLFEETGENISTDCLKCNGTGAINKTDFFEVRCPRCGAYLELQTEASELGVIDGICEECGYDGEMQIVGEDDGL